MRKSYQVVQNIKNSKDIYRELCEEYDIPLFMQAWWLDAVCSAEKKIWNVFLVTINGKIVGAMPYHMINKFGFKIIAEPQLSQYNGIWFNYPENQTIYQRLSFEKKVCFDIINQIVKKRISYFQQSFHFSFTNWLPFHWRNYSQSTRYTYIIPDISNPEQVLDFFSYAKKKQIRKSEKSLSISFNLSSDEFYKLHSKFQADKGAKTILSKSIVSNCIKSATSRDQGFIVSAIDKNDNIHAAAFIVFDSSSAYYLISAINPDFKDSGGSTFIISESIKYLSNKTISFDFEGSMIESIENSFRQFGTVQVPYFQIHKYNSLIFRIIFNIKKWF